MRIESKDENWCWKLGRGGVHNKYENLSVKHHKGSQRPVKCPLTSMCFYMLHIFVQNVFTKKRGKGRCVMNDIAGIITSIIANITFLIQAQSKIK
jgi:hypothetical protein